jgi:hypothetical protein
MVYCCMHETVLLHPHRNVVLMLEFVVKIDVNEFLIYFFCPPFCVGYITVPCLSTYSKDKTLNGLQ